MLRQMINDIAFDWRNSQPHTLADKFFTATIAGAMACQIGLLGLYLYADKECASTNDRASAECIELEKLEKVLDEPKPFIFF